MGQRITRHVGVYAIRHVRSGRKYIGGSVDVVNRYTFHRFGLRGGNHKNKKLQVAWDKYGESAFVFEILEKCSREELEDRETFWIQNSYRPYNMMPNATGIGYSGGAKKRWAKPEYREKQIATRSRLGLSRGSKNRQAKLTEALVKSLRREYLAGYKRLCILGETYGGIGRLRRSLCAKYGIETTAFYNAVSTSGRNWRHVP